MVVEKYDPEARRAEKDAKHAEERRKRKAMKMDPSKGSLKSNRSKDSAKAAG